jgi:hypothetical protein
VSAVVVAGALAQKPGNGGEAWVRLSWLRGIADLGIDVHLVESADVASDGPEAAWFDAVTAQHGLTGRATLLDARGRRLRGPDLAPVADDGAALLDLSGSLADPALLARFGRRAYVDLDPGWTQLWDAAGLLGDALDRYDTHLTVGDAVARCGLPQSGRRWQPVRPLVPADRLGRRAAAGRGRPAEHRRQLAQPVGHDAARRPRPRRQGADVAPAGRAAGAGAPALHGRGGRARRRRRRPRPAAGRRVDAAGAVDGRHARRLPGVRARLQRRAVGRPGDVRRDALRLDERPHRRLPGQRPARRRAGHRLARAAPQPRPADVHHLRGRGRGLPRARRGVPGRAGAGRARAGRRVFSTRTVLPRVLDLVGVR